MTQLRDVSWWMVWIVLVSLFGAQVLGYAFADRDRQEIKDALRVKPYEVMEKLREIEAELEKRDRFFDQLREQGLIGNGNG